MTDPHLRPLFFNGINADTGEYLLPPLSPEVISRIARGERVEPKLLAELKWRYQRSSKVTLGVKAGVDSDKLSEAGWGVIFAYNSSPAISDALAPLLEHRKMQAGRYYREYSGSLGYRPNETKIDFLARNGIGPGPADPDKVPYYLLIVGDPESIPFKFQYQLDVQYAVGRLSFDTPAEYANYAASVVTAETRPLKLSRRVAFFAPENDGDDPTALSSRELAIPLANANGGILSKLNSVTPSWESKSYFGKDASKSNLTSILGGAETPAFLFTASHGVGFPSNDPLQFRRQGALLCQDWPGPSWKKSIPENFYFSRDDISNDANPFGLIAFFFACYGGGTPRLDDFAHASFSETRPTLAPHSFLAGLPRRLLGHPNGGALAVVAHIDRAWGYSFHWEKAGRQLAVFESTLKLLLEGRPVGASLEFFNERFAELSTSLSDELEEIKYGKTPDDYALANLWTANNDARSFVVLGDPAVRLAVPKANDQPEPRPVLTLTIPEAESISAAQSFGVDSTASGDGAVLLAPNPPAPDTASRGSILSVIAATESRFAARIPDATPPVSFGLGTPRTFAVNPPDRVRKRLQRLGLPEDEINTLLTIGRPSFAIIPPRGSTPSLVRVGLERILSRNNLIGVEFLASALNASRSVGRVLIRSGLQVLGYGSGAMVSPRLFLTNNHVLDSAAIAAGSTVQFGYEYKSGKVQEGREVPLDPDAFFLTDVALDFSLVAVRPEADLSDVGWLQMNDDAGGVLKEEYVNIVQHPNGRPKQVALRDNQVTDILPDFLHYRADTEPGSSGSPVFNDQWELIGLHHSGVPKRNDQGQVLARGGAVWTLEMGDAAIDWIANEGVRIRRILAFLKSAPLPDTQYPLREQLLTTVISRPHVPAFKPSAAPEDVPITPQTPPESTRAEFTPPGAGGGITVNIPIRIDISLNGADLPTVTVGGAAPAGPAPAALAVPGWVEAISIDPNYDTRAGYDPSFLGVGRFYVPLPKLPPGLLASASRNLRNAPGENPHLFNYHHYSVVMNARRRLAFFTAVNIDGRTSASPRRETDRWFYDPRLPKDEQCGNELYDNNPFDRGHLVRRLDPAWGASPAIVKVANDDTFHFTNCSPQHERFNQGKNLWAGLEDFLLARASAEGKRLTVFTGPVFRDDDNEYRGVLIPREYWKVAVYAKTDGNLISAAFRVSQEKLIKSLTDESTVEETAKSFQVTVAEIEQLTRLSFGALRAADVMKTGPGVSFTLEQPGTQIELTDESFIKVE